MKIVAVHGTTLDKDKKVDLIVGGFPCQGFSMSGYRVVADPRNSLYLEMLDIVNRIRPEFIVMENVEGLRSMLNGKVEEKIINDYAKIGYQINVTVLNAADYYTPQTRKRVIFIGNRIGAKNYHPKPLLDENHYKTVGNAISKFLDMPENSSKHNIKQFLILQFENCIPDEYFDKISLANGWIE